MAAVLRAVRHPHQSYLSYKNSLTTSLSNRIASCAETLKQFHSTYLDSESPFRKSAMGRVIVGLGLETIGAVAGAAIGGSLMGAACKRLAPVIAVAGIGGALYSLRGRVALVTAAALCVPCAMIALPSAFNLMTLWIGGVGAWVGANGGIILGGYAGLRLFGSKVTLWDRTNNYNTYATLMGVSIVAGEIFQRALSPELPWSLLRFGRPIVQMFVYNISSIFGICKSLLRERKFKQEVVIPLIVKSLCDKYCEENAQPFTNHLVRALSSTVGIVPWMEEQVQFFLKLECFQTFCKREIERFKENSHKITAALMRGFGQYMQLVKKNKSLEKLEKAIPSAPLRFVNFFCSTQTDAMAASILTSIQQSGIDLYGNPIPVDIIKYKPLLSMHIRFFLTYFLCRLDLRDLKEREEQIFISELVDAFTSILDQDCSSHRISRLLGGGIKRAVPPAYFLKRHIGSFLEPPEQSAHMESRFQAPPGLGSTRPVHVEWPVDISQYEQVTFEDAMAAVDDYAVRGADFQALAGVAALPEPKRPVPTCRDVSRDYVDVFNYLMKDVCDSKDDSPRPGLEIIPEEEEF